MSILFVVRSESAWRKGLPLLHSMCSDRDKEKIFVLPLYYGANSAEELHGLPSVKFLDFAEYVADANEVFSEEINSIADLFGNWYFAHSDSESWIWYFDALRKDSEEPYAKEFFHLLCGISAAKKLGVKSAVCLGFSPGFEEALNANLAGMPKSTVIAQKLKSRFPFRLSQVKCYFSFFLLFLRGAFIRWFVGKANRPFEATTLFLTVDYPEYLKGRLRFSSHYGALPNMLVDNGKKVANVFIVEPSLRDAARLLRNFFSKKDFRKALQSGEIVIPDSVFSFRGLCTARKKIVKETTEALDLLRASKGFLTTASGLKIPLGYFSCWLLEFQKKTLWLAWLSELQCWAGSRSFIGKNQFISYLEYLPLSQAMYKGFHKFSSTLKTFGLQHATVSRNKGVYLIPPSFVQGGRSTKRYPVPKYMFCFGSFFSEFLLKVGFSGDAVLSIGALRYESLLSANQASRKRIRRRILIVGTYDYEDALNLINFSAKVSIENVDVFFRAHPALPLRSLIPKTVGMHTGKLNLQDFDLVISTYSSVLDEALANGVQAMAICFPNSPILSDLFDLQNELSESRTFDPDQALEKIPFFLEKSEVAAKDRVVIRERIFGMTSSKSGSPSERAAGYLLDHGCKPTLNNR